MVVSTEHLRNLTTSSRGVRYAHVSCLLAASGQPKCVLTRGGRDRRTSNLFGC